MLRVALVLSAVTASLLATTATADPVHTGKSARPASFMRVFGPAAPPFGFVQFCNREWSECQPVGKATQRFDATPYRLGELDRINRLVNNSIAPATDQELYGREEYWTLPTHSGDCEDYALLKRKMLIERGWPSSALLMTVVRDERGDGHAILTARTTKGDFILDNKVADVRIWYRTSYHYVMRQSYIDPRMWMSLEPGLSEPGAPLTSQPASRR
jgi:predicted transglutaminase-like cysteine proteinase